MIVLSGIPSSAGIIMGKILIKNEVSVPVLKECLDSNFEKKRFKEARLHAIEQLSALYKKTLVKMGEKEADIFIAQMSILEDLEFINAVELNVDQEVCNAEWALKLATDFFLDIFDQMDDPYIKERGMDIKDISKRIQSLLMGLYQENIYNLDEPVIIIAHDLTPSDTASMDHSKVLGFVTEVGGKTSHTAIIARTIGIPAVVGMVNIVSQVSDDQVAIIDGRDGKVYIEPDEATMAYYRNEKLKIEVQQLKLNQIKNTKAITKDGKEIELAANIGSTEDLDYLDVLDLDGIGLFRTEFLYMSRDTFPNEEEQFEAYKQVAEALKGKPVVIRTLDIGGDKELSYLKIEKEMNPFLGFRAIRLCLERIELWKTQLRAIVRASAHGYIKIMFPMISTYKELLQAKKILQEVRNELKLEGVPFDEELQVGMMMETPSAAIMADVFAKEVDFFSIGTNDLIQYTIAVDRMNPLVSHLYSPFDPAVIRLIKKVVDAAHEAGIGVGMCGEAASDVKAIPLWLGMGLDELSMSGSSILEVKWGIQAWEVANAQKLSREILTLKTADEIEEKLTQASIAE